MERKEYIVLILQFYEEEDQWIGDCESLGVMSHGDTIDEARKSLESLVSLTLNAWETARDTRVVVCGKGNCHKDRRMAKSRPNFADACTQPFDGIAFATNGSPVKCPRCLPSKENSRSNCRRRMVGKIEDNLNMGSISSSWYRGNIGLPSCRSNPIHFLRHYWVVS